MSMHPIPQLKAELSKTVGELYRDTVPAVSEARCVWKVGQRFKNFVFAAEGARFDAGLVVADMSGVSASENGRLFEVLEKFQDQKVLLGIDCKTINTRGVHEELGIIYHGYRTGLTAAQRHCALILIQNPAAPHLVAVVPRHALERGEVGGKSRHRYWRDVPTFLHDSEPFPIELSPYVLPLELLPDALQNFLIFYQNPQAGWLNPYSKIVVRDLPQPTLSVIEMLKPDPASFLNDLEEEILIWRSFHHHSIRYRVERIMVKPGIGDFVFVHTASGRRMSVEMKKNMATYRDGEIRHLAQRKRGSKVMPRLFSPMVQWDFLLSIIPAQSMALFTSRTNLPDSWLQREEETHSWTPPPECLVPWFSSLNDMQTFVQAIEVVLDHHLSSQTASDAAEDNRFGAIAQFKQEPFVAYTDLEALNSHGKTTEHAQHTTETPPNRRKHRPSRQRQFEATQAHYIHHQCRQRKFGALYQLGVHPTAAFVYAPAPWVNGSPLSFYDLSLDYPMLPINFAEIELAGMPQPNDRGEQIHFLHATHGNRAALYILVSIPDEFAGQGLNCYVVPSTEIGCDQIRQQRHEEVTRQRIRHSTRHPLPLRLASGEPLSIYACPDNSVVSHLEMLCRNWAANAHTDTCSPERGLRESHNLSTMEDMIITKQEIIQEALDVEFGRTFWSFHIRTVGDGRGRRNSEANVAG